MFRRLNLEHLLIEKTDEMFEILRGVNLITA
jgi:hypothetical protein